MTNTLTGDAVDGVDGGRADAARMGVGMLDGVSLTGVAVLWVSRFSFASAALLARRSSRIFRALSS